MTKVNGFQVNHRHTEEVDKINHSIHSHHMQECVCVWLISDKKQKHTLTSGMCTFTSLGQLRNNSRLISYTFPKQDEATQQNNPKPFCLQDAGLFVDICQFLDSLK